MHNVPVTVSLNLSLHGTARLTELALSVAYTLANYSAYKPSEHSRHACLSDAVPFTGRCAC